MQIIQAPNEVLSKKAEEVKKVDKKIVNLINEMKITLEQALDPEGVGIAAPQVNKSLQIFIIKEDKKAPFKVFINPKMEIIKEPKMPKKSKKTKADTQLEGCLSLKDIWGEVKRENKLRLEWLNENGEKQNEIFTGFLATIIQHEYDHLQGILFPKRVLEQNNKLYKLKRNKNNKEVFEEIVI